MKAAVPSDSGCPMHDPTPHHDAGTPAHAGAHMDFRETMSYGDYLSLGTLLDSQHPRSADHNELLFIIQHQATELWLKLVLHELSAAREQMCRDDLQPAFKMLSRVARIFAQLVQSWDVLATLTPSEYSAFRPSLGNSSGFQSHQYRLLEFLLGNRNEALVRPFAHRPEIHAVLAAELARPSLYDEALRLLARRGLPVPAARCERDWSRRPEAPPGAGDAAGAGAGTAADPDADPDANASGSVEAAWAVVYADPAAHWDLYELAEKLVDLEDAFRQWRFRHVTTVERIIGNKRGTGGTSGVGYLRQAVGIELFPELWRVRTRL